MEKPTIKTLRPTPQHSWPLNHCPTSKPAKPLRFLEARVVVFAKMILLELQASAQAFNSISPPKAAGRPLWEQTRARCKRPEPCCTASSCFQKPPSALQQIRTRTGGAGTRLAGSWTWAWYMTQCTTCEAALWKAVDAGISRGGVALLDCSDCWANFRGVEAVCGFKAQIPPSRLQQMVTRCCPSKAS